MLTKDEAKAICDRIEQIEDLLAAGDYSSKEFEELTDELYVLQEQYATGWLGG